VVAFARGRVRATLALLLVCSSGGALHAQGGLAPRLLSPVPVGVNFGAVGYVNSSGNVLLDEALPLEDTQAQLHSIFASYVRSIDLFGLSGRISASVPMANGKWTAELDGRDTTTVRNGVGDPVVGLGIALVGAPAMRAADFATYRPRLVVGTSVLVRVPIGQYDSARFFNVGTNRWQAIVGVGAGLHTGRWEFELHVRGWFNATNDDFFGGNRLSQRPLVGFQLHGAYAFKRGLWAALSVGQSFGGATVTNGVEQDNSQQNNRIGATIGVPIHRAWGLKAAYTVGVATRFGGDFDVATIGVTYFWGGRK
jgi:hypothetical protein